MLLRISRGITSSARGKIRLCFGRFRIVKGFLESKLIRRQKGVFKLEAFVSNCKFNECVNHVTMIMNCVMHSWDFESNFVVRNLVRNAYNSHINQSLLTRIRMNGNGDYQFWGLPMYGWGTLAVLVIIVGIWAMNRKYKT